MSAGSWSDRYTRAQLAAELDAIRDRAPLLSLAAMALRNGEPSDELADALEDFGDTVAMRWGNYDAHSICADAAAALRDESTPNDGATVTGSFHAVRSSVIGGVAVTEYEADETSERYVAVGLGRSDQPPELVRVIVTDPDEAYDDARERGELP